MYEPVQISWMTRKQGFYVFLTCLLLFVILLITVTAFSIWTDQIHEILFSLGLLLISAYQYWFTYYVSVDENYIFIENGRGKFIKSIDEEFKVESVSGFTYRICFKNGQTFNFNCAPDFHFGVNRNKANMLERIIRTGHENRRP